MLRERGQEIGSRNRPKARLSTKTRPKSAPRQSFGRTIVSSSGSMVGEHAVLLAITVIAHQSRQLVEISGTVAKSDRILKFGPYSPLEIVREDDQEDYP